MPPEFWSNLPAIIVAIGGFYAVIMQNRKLARELQENTIQTVLGQRQVAEKVDSATKEATVTATNVAKVAATAAIQASAATARVLEQTKEIAEKTDKLDNKLNGGPGGLHELHERVSHIEGKFEKLEAGQVEISNALDSVRKEIMGVGAEVRKQSKF